MTETVCEDCGLVIDDQRTTHARARMKDLLMQLTGRSHSTVIAECRQCGTTVEVETSKCPECGHDGIAIYRFD